jgi:hypothetical protein
MNKLILLTTLIGILMMSCQTEKRNMNTLKLPLEWKFQTGDNTEYANPFFDDQAWKSRDFLITTELPGIGCMS